MSSKVAAGGSERVRSDVEIEQDLTETEELIAAVWLEITGRRHSRRDNFFKRGGDSLAASRVVARLWSEVSVRATLAGFFANPILEDFARYVATLRTRDFDNVEMPKARRDQFPVMSPAQETIVRNHCAQLREGQPENGRAGFVSLVAEILAPVSNATISDALRLLTDHHESLRMGLTLDVVGGSGYLTVASAVDPRLEVRDCQDLPPEKIYDLLEEQQEALSSEPLDRTVPPMWRSCLIRLSPSHAILMVVIDHFVADGISAEILFDELVEILDGRLPDAVEEPDFLDWVHWRRRRFSGPTREELARFWRTNLAGSGPYPDLALPAPASQPGRIRQVASLRLDPRQTAQLLETAAHHGATPFLACLTAIALAWQRARGVSDVLVHTPVANRLEPRFARVVGWMAHTIPIRTLLRADSTPIDALEAVRASALEAVRHQDMRLSEIAAEFPTADEEGNNRQRLFFGFEQVDDGLRCITGGVVRRVHFPIRAADRARERAIAQHEAMSTSGLSFYGDISEGCLSLGVVVDARDAAVEFFAELQTELRGVLDELSQSQEGIPES